MQVNTERRSLGLREKLPDIQKTLDVVRFLKTRKVRVALSLVWKQDLETDAVVQPESEPLETTFELNDTLFAKAMVPPTEEVYLWLGVGIYQGQSQRSRSH